MTRHTVLECLQTLGVTEATHFDGCESVHDEFRVVKKAFFALSLTTHPDKGGDAATFRAVRTAFEALREMFTKHQVASFADVLEAHAETAAPNYDDIYQGFATGPVPSYEYYYEAAQEEMPLYRVELAKSGRSQCKKCIAKKKPKKPRGKKKQLAADNDDVVVPEAEASMAVTIAASSTLSTNRSNFVPDCAIAKGDVRFGSLDSMSGAYGRWHCVSCWRVPAKVWRGLPDPENTNPSLDDIIQALLGMDEVLLCGVSELSRSNQELIAEHIQNKENWAKAYKKRAKKEASVPPAAAASTRTTASATGGGAASSALVPKQTAMVKAKQRFVVLRPGVDGPADVLAGKTFVLTGIFPEVGGGVGLNLGKAKLKAMIESFGGRVTGSVSGKTNVLITGKEPGLSKVTAARERGITMMDVAGLCNVIKGKCSLEEAPAPTIRDFSAGYGGNGLALLASEQHAAYARGNPGFNPDAKPWSPSSQWKPNADAKPWSPSSKSKPSEDANPAQPADDNGDDEENLAKKMPAKKKAPAPAPTSDSNALVPSESAANEGNKNAPRKKKQPAQKKKKKGAKKATPPTSDSNAIVPADQDKKKPPRKRKQTAQAKKKKAANSASEKAAPGVRRSKRLKQN